jgi:hypothetical protein
VSRTKAGRGPRRIRRPRDPIPRRPYRDSAIFYAILALIVVAVAWATGGELVRAIIFGGGFFLVATSWSWWRFRQRIEEERVEPRGESGGDQ